MSAISGIADRFDMVRPRRGISSAVLQLIALLTMLTDHVGYVFFTGAPAYGALRSIGRISFPIFAFLIAEGCAHTRDIRRYTLRLAALAILSEIPHDLAFFGTWFYPESQNILFSFTAAAAVTGLWQRFRGTDLMLPVLALGAAVCGLAELGSFEYGAAGLLLVFVFYCGRDTRNLRLLAAGAWMAFAWWGTGRQLFALCALPVLFFYNGARGARLPKWLTYGFYPLHLILLFLLSSQMI